MHTPSVHDGDDAGAVDADLLPRRLRHVEVRPRRVAPAAAVAGDAPVGRAEVGGRDGHRGAALAPRRRVAVAHDQVALPARRAVVEQHRAQRRRVRPVPRLVQVPVPARATCIGRITRHGTALCVLAPIHRQNLELFSLTYPLCRRRRARRRTSPSRSSSPSPARRTSPLGRRVMRRGLCPSLL